MRSEHLLKHLKGQLVLTEDSCFAIYMLDGISGFNTARNERIKPLLVQIPWEYRRIEDLRKFLEEHHV